MTQPETLRLADALDKSHANRGLVHQAAAELRRLHIEVQQLKSDLSEEVLISNAILETKDELLAALQAILSDGLHCDVVPHLHEKACAAIAKGATK